MRRIGLVALGWLAMIIVGCSADTDRGSSQSGDDPMEAKLPHAGGDAPCVEGSGGELSLCGWADATDALVYGEVASVQFVETSEVYGENSGELLEPGECESNDGLVVPVLEIELEVIDTLVGDAGPNSEEFVFRIGPAAYGIWDPMVLYDENEGFYWEDEDYSIQTGQILIVAAHDFESDGQWTLYWERLVQVSTDEYVEFQEGYDCSPAFPEDWQDAELSDFLLAASDCSGDSHEGMERKQDIHDYWQDRDAPWETVASVCAGPTEVWIEDDEECGGPSHQSCDEGELCINNECREADCFSDEYCDEGEECVDFLCQ